MSANSVYFRHCEKPTLEPLEGVVKGAIPEWLEGTLIRNGSGIQEFGGDRYNHAFDGLSVLHRIHISNGKASYSNRPLESLSYKINSAAQRIVVSQFGTAVTFDPCHATFASLKTEFKELAKGARGMDNCAVNVVHIGDQLYAMTETHETIRVDPKTLLPIGKTTVIPAYVAINTATAHPHVLPNGNVVNMGQHFSNKKGPHYSFFQVPPKFNSEETAYSYAMKICDIPVTHKATPSYFHSFGMTKDKIILVESPFRINVAQLMRKEGSTLDAHFWQDGEKTRFLVASMETGEPHSIVYETDDLFIFHHANTYEEKGHLVVDVAGYNHAKYVKENMNHDTLGKICQTDVGGSLRRYVLPLKIPEGSTGNLVALKNTCASAVLRAGTNNVVDVEPQILYPAWFEFPKINYRLNGLKNRYIYGAANSKVEDSKIALQQPNMILKVDTETGEILTWSEENVITGEPIFVANPSTQNSTEDDGVLLVFLLHQNDVRKVTLLVLDAQKWTEIARAEFRAEGTVAGTFHGQWASDREKIHSY